MALAAGRAAGHYVFLDLEFVQKGLVAKNTRENALFTKEMLESHHYSIDETYLLITSAFHMYRAEGCFKKAGVKVDTFPVDYYGNDRILDYKGIVQPNPNAILIWHKLVKEWLGITMYRLVGYM